MSSHGAFIAAAIAEFPELRDELAVDGDLPHLQMGTFARFTNRAISTYDRATVKRAFALARQFFPDGDAALLNEFYVSYLEALDLESPAGHEAKKLMPPLLLRGWDEINEYLENLGTKSG